MKKTLAILLAAFMLLSVTACGNNLGADISAVELDINAIDDTFVADTGTYKYEYVESETIRITKYNGTEELHDLVIPTTMNGKTVVEIADGAFYSSSNIKSVVIPDSVTKIGANAFAACRELITATIPASLTALSANAFYSCGKLQTVTFSNTENAALTTIGASAFNGCVALSQITLPATVKTIAKAAFFNCESLTAMTLPTGLETIEAQAFQSCDNLATVAFGASLVVCEPFAFEGCQKLSSVSLGVLDGWSVALNYGTDDEEKIEIAFPTPEVAIEYLTEVYFNYTFVRALPEA